MIHDYLQQYHTSESQQKRRLFDVCNPFAEGIEMVTIEDANDNVNHEVMDASQGLQWTFASEAAKHLYDLV